MGLPPQQLRQYARHIVLPEIGEEGQRRIGACRPRVATSASSRAADWALAYLERAGCDAGDGDPSPVDVPSDDEVSRIAGSPDLLHAAELFAGAFAAVERIKASVRAGEGGDPRATRLSGDD